MGSDIALLENAHESIVGASESDDQRRFVWSIFAAISRLAIF